MDGEQTIMRSKRIDDKPPKSHWQDTTGVGGRPPCVGYRDPDVPAT